MENKEKVNQSNSTTVQTQTIEQPKPPVVDPLASITGRYKVTSCQKPWFTHLNKDLDEQLLFGKAPITFCAPRDIDNPGKVITGLTKDEEEAFENAMTLQKGSLSSYKIGPNDYWTNFKNHVKVPRTDEGLTLDCNNSIQAKLWYKLLLANKMRVASSREDLQFKSTAEVVITSMEQEAKTGADTFNLKAKAYAKFGNMSQQDRIDFLKVYGEGSLKVNKDTKPSVVDDLVGKVVDNYPKEFLATFDSIYYKDYVFLQDSLSIGAVERRNNKYYERGETSDFGSNLANAVAFLGAVDGQELKMRLQGKLFANK